MSTKKRGPARGSRQTPWTETEWAVIRDALEHGRQSTRAKDLAESGRLPGRSRENIHNALSLERRRQSGLCMRGCGKTVEHPGSSCSECVALQRERQQQKKREGRCIRCGEPLGEGASATNCQRCRDKAKKYHGKTTKRFKQRADNLPPRDPRLASRRVLPWPACGHIKWAAKLAAASGRPVVDLFGGSGEPLRLVHEFDGKVHAYNDIHPGLHALVTASKNNDDIKTIAHLLQGKDTPNPPDNLVLAAQTVRNARTPGASYDKRVTANLRRLGRALHNAAILNLDAIDCLNEPEAFPHNTIFILDPPWPGADRQFEHKLTNQQYAQLLQALLDLPYEQDYILMLGSERQAVELAAKYMPHAPMFWRASGALFTKSIVALSPRLARLPDQRDLGIRINFADLGLVNP